MTKVLSRLQEIKTSPHSEQLLQKHAYFGMSEAEKQRYQQLGCKVYQGKVRELVQRGSSLYIFHTDRLSAFDCFIGMVPYKGLILSELSRYWLEKAREVVPTHLIRAVNERILEVQSCEPIKAEIIVRGYLAGSMMRAYEKGARSFCGEALPEGLQAFQGLPEPIITPTTKAAAFEHDEDVSGAELIAQGVCSESEWQQISEMALKLFAQGQKVFGEKGWILVDTKYEFGRLPSGKVIVIDEIHTPDSSRLWHRPSYQQRLAAKQPPQMLDKENVRRYLLDQGFSGTGPVPTVPAKVLVELAEVYLQVAEALIGDELTIKCDSYDLDVLPPLNR